MGKLLKTTPLVPKGPNIKIKLFKHFLKIFYLLSKSDNHSVFANHNFGSRQKNVLLHLKCNFVLPTCIKTLLGSEHATLLWISSKAHIFHSFGNMPKL